MLDESDGDESDPDLSIDTDIASNISGHFILKGDWQKFLGEVPDGGWSGDIRTHDMPDHGLIMTKGKKWCILGRKMKRDCREVAGSSARCGWCTLAGRPFIPEDLLPGALVDKDTTKVARKHALAVGHALNLAENAEEKRVKQKIAFAKRLKAEVDKDENAVLVQVMHRLESVEEAVTAIPHTEEAVVSIFETVKMKLVDEDASSGDDL
ncbi:hypothetical protein B0T14DRAFT_495380 [Immersiella caudata]|uniref:Uncharacterized protein n=1 Tax=Immersiella caudata TaxID=314043 RepID=A0AA39WYN8_9PEZI|nr:hypothetical protein B0T14DRAFT_495380 [Immersiella caudata]